MEQLQKISQWFTTLEEREATDYRENYFPVIEIMPNCKKSIFELLDHASQDLISFAEYREVKPGKIWASFDIDYVLRKPTSELSRLYPGRLPDQSIQVLKKLESKGVKIGAFITNQPLEGHQIARAVGRLRNYQPIKDTLQNHFPETKIISAKKNWDFIFKRPKTSDDNAQYIANIIDKENHHLFAYFGDRYDVDADFWVNVQSRTTDQEDKFVFVKMPDPSTRIPALSHYSFIVP